MEGFQSLGQGDWTLVGDHFPRISVVNAAPASAAQGLGDGFNTLAGFIYGGVVKTDLPQNVVKQNCCAGVGSKQSLQMR